MRSCVAALGKCGSNPGWGRSRQELCGQCDRGLQPSRAVAGCGLPTAGGRVGDHGSEGCVMPATFGTLWPAATPSATTTLLSYGDFAALASSFNVEQWIASWVPRDPGVRRSRRAPTRIRLRRRRSRRPPVRSTSGEEHGWWQLSTPRRRISPQRSSTRISRVLRAHALGRQRAQKTLEARCRRCRRD